MKIKYDMTDNYFNERFYNFIMPKQFGRSIEEYWQETFTKSFLNW